MSVELTWTHFCLFLLSPFIHPTLSGKSALHWAAAVNNVEATLVLLKNGANRDMQDNKVPFGVLVHMVFASFICCYLLDTLITIAIVDESDNDVLACL